MIFPRERIMFIGRASILDDTAILSLLICRGGGRGDQDFRIKSLDELFHDLHLSSSELYFEGVTEMPAELIRSGSQRGELYYLQ